MDQAVEIFAIARDVTIIIFGVVTTILMVVLSVVVIKAAGRFNRAVDRANGIMSQVEALLDAAKQARDAIANISIATRSRKKSSASNNSGGINAVSLLTFPMRLILKRIFRNNRRGDNDTA